MAVVQSLETIPVLLQQYFGLFETHNYASINIGCTEGQQKCHFPNPSTLSFCWHNIGMFPYCVYCVAFVITICTIIVHSEKKGSLAAGSSLKKTTLTKKSSLLHAKHCYLAGDPLPQIDHAQKCHLSHDQLWIQTPGNGSVNKSFSKHKEDCTMYIPKERVNQLNRHSACIRPPSPVYCSKDDLGYFLSENIFKSNSEVI